MSQSVESYQPELLTLERGLGGLHGQGPNYSTSIPDRRLRCYYGDVVEGGYVIDKRDVLAVQPGLAIASPMCRGSLPMGKTSRFAEACPNAAESIVGRAIASCPENSASGLAQMMMVAPDCGAFDEVAPDVFAAWWRRHGARIGQRAGNFIVWENGEREEIRPVQFRYMTPQRTMWPDED